MKIDTMVFDTVKNDFEKFMKNFIPEIIQNSELYVFNNRQLDTILALEQILYREYGSLENYKNFNLSNIVKIVKSIKSL